MSWVLFRIYENIYAVPCIAVLSLFQLKKITNLPNPPQEIRGVIEYQGKIIQLLNINKIFNVKTNEEDINEFREMIEARRQDHINWIEELKNSVFENREFKLTTDEHKCKFGIWYDAYIKTCDNVVIKSVLKKFDKPHKNIHHLGIIVKKFTDNHDNQSALDLINKTKDNELKQMMGLFDEIKEVYANSKKDIVVVIGTENELLSFAVEEIVSIEELIDISLSNKDNVDEESYIKGIAKRKTGEPVFILNDEYIVDKFAKKENSYSLS